MWLGAMAQFKPERLAHHLVDAGLVHQAADFRGPGTPGIGRDILAGVRRARQRLARLFQQLACASRQA